MRSTLYHFQLSKKRESTALTTMAAVSLLLVGRDSDVRVFHLIPIVRFIAALTKAYARLLLVYVPVLIVLFHVQQEHGREDKRWLCCDLRCPFASDVNVERPVAANIAEQDPALVANVIAMLRRLHTDQHAQLLVLASRSGCHGWYTLPCAGLVPTFNILDRLRLA